MRLGQAARSYKTTTDNIAGLLKENFREVNCHPNVKLTDEEMEFLNTLFAAKENTQEEQIDFENIVDQEFIQNENQEDIPAYIEELRPKVITLEKEFTEQTEGLDSYKAEKVALEGLKVVGKIDLPLEKPKEDKVREERKNTSNTKRSYPQKSKKQKTKGELSPAELRAKEQRIAYKKKIEEEKRLKTLKKEHYEVHVKSRLKPTKSKKKKSKIATSPKPSKEAQIRTEKAKKATGIKRFWLWLNGAYDKQN